MVMRDYLRNLMRLLHAPSRRGNAAATPAPAETSGRPAYASPFEGDVTLPREVSFALLEQFRKSVPVLKRAVEILSGFVGVPEFQCATDAATADLNAWAENVAFGRIGCGLAPWISDHLGQALTFGYAVGEAAIDPARQDVERIWSYSSPQFTFKSDQSGAIKIVQSGTWGVERVLDPLRCVLTVHDPAGSNPQGQSLFLSIPTFAQIWLDIAAAHRATWRRSGVPRFHVNWEYPQDFSDPSGTVAPRIREQLETAWNDGMRSAVMDGRVKDFFTTGKVTVSTVGADGQLIPITDSKRNIVEELVVATGIPAWMFGYSWSTTERLSQQQADMLTATVEDLRREVGGSIRQIVALRQRLTGKREAQQFQLVWPSINLQDAAEQARAALLEAQAKATEQKTARQLWADGVYSQEQYAEQVTGSTEVERAMDEPSMAAAADTGQMVFPASGAERVLAEVAAEYPDLRHGVHSN